jgi:hypothetical protein
MHFGAGDRDDEAPPPSPSPSRSSVRTGLAVAIGLSPRAGSPHRVLGVAWRAGFVASRPSGAPRRGRVGCHLRGRRCRLPPAPIIYAADFPPAGRHGWTTAGLAPPSIRFAARGRRRKSVCVLLR